MQLTRDAQPIVVEEIHRVVAEAIGKAMKEAGFGKNGKKETQQPPKIAYSPREAASIGSISRSTLYGAIRRRELRIVKKGARTLVLDRDLRRWLEGLPPING
jgi:excisionase family DNA binding protein